MDFYVTSNSKYRAKSHPAGYQFLFAASSWFNSEKGKFRKLKLPLTVDRFAIDCGGFVAARIWGDYRYTSDQYINWINSLLLSPEWVAIMDYCCEDEITAGKSGIIHERQLKTTDNIERFYQLYRNEPYVFVPTVQGWNVADYVRHAHEIKPLVEKWQKFYEQRGQGDLFRVGIGTLCARPFTADIQQIVKAVADILPAGKFHLWGVKLQVLKSRIELPRVVSVDSAAWNGLFGKDRHPASRECQALGITKSVYEFNVALPRYMRKVQKALEQPKQKMLL